jgi:ubiquinone/menaquinone biosynthesis C-methylase UbiE
MGQDDFPLPDENGIIRALPKELSESNRKRISKFGAFMFLYDFIQNNWVRQRIHKSNPKRHHEIMHEAIAPVRRAVVLDIACGTGGAIAHFHSSNDYTGLDLSYAMLRQALKKASARGFHKFTLIEGNAEELFFRDESFDFVLIDTSLHMIPEYRRCMAECARVLKKSGDLLCSCPTVGINEEFDALWERIALKRRLHAFTESDFQAACSSLGLRYNRIATNGGMLYFRARKA